MKKLLIARAPLGQRGESLIAAANFADRAAAGKLATTGWAEFLAALAARLSCFILVANLAFVRHGFFSFLILSNWFMGTKLLNRSKPLINNFSAINLTGCVI
jgi:hypothetical protein